MSDQDGKPWANDWTPAKGTWPTFGTTETEFRRLANDGMYAHWIQYWELKPDTKRQGGTLGTIAKIASPVTSLLGGPLSLIPALGGALLKKGDTKDKIQAGTNVFAAEQGVGLLGDLLFSKSGAGSKGSPDTRTGTSGVMGPNKTDAFPDGDRPGETFITKYWWVGAVLIVLLIGWLVFRKK